MIVTLGANGSIYADSTGKKGLCSARKVTVKDTTGAGDTFLGTFMVAINAGLNMFDAITFANICAGLKTQKLGAQTGMPKLDEVKKYIKKNKVKLELNF